MPGLLLALVLSSLPCASADSGEAVSSAAAAKSVVARRLLGTLSAEPLLAIYAEDVRVLPAKFSRTCLSAMLNDPSYAQGAAKLRALIAEGAGADIRALWPDFSKMIQGPAVLAIEPLERPAPTEPECRLVLLVTTPTEETARQLLALWPKPPPQSNTLFAALRLRPVLARELPAEERLPRWLTATPWPQGDVCVRALPRKLSAALGPWLEAHDELGMGWGLAGSLLSGAYGEATERLTLSFTLNGELFAEEALLETLPENTALARAAATVRERPESWDRLLSAMPGAHDLVLLAQLDLPALGPDLPFAAQALERYLRGKKWSRSRGRMEEALDPRRFDFLLRRADGSFGIAAKPALSGDLRVAVAAGLSGAGDELGGFQKELLEGLEGVGAEFEALAGVPRAANGTAARATAPLAAKFQGRGLFGAPVIGLGPGWAWLCSSSAAYQELVNAFKTGRTLAADCARDKAALKAADRPEEWRSGDAARLQIALEKVLKLAYASWMLSAESAFYIGSWKVPFDLLPQPQLFNNRLGVLRAGLSRQGHVLRSYASSALPGTSLLLPYVVYEAADTVENSRLFSRTALELLKEDAEAPAGQTGAPVLLETEPQQDALRHGAGKKP